MPSETPTRYAVQCPTHGQVFLTEDEYNKQLWRAWERWKCPFCGLDAQFDDDNYEERSTET